MLVSRLVAQRASGALASLDRKVAPLLAPVAALGADIEADLIDAAGLVEPETRVLYNTNLKTRDAKKDAARMLNKNLLGEHMGPFRVLFRESSNY